MDDLRTSRDGPSAGDFSAADDEVTCQQFVELITAYLEGALTTRTLSRVEEHLVMCDWCVTYLGQMDATIAALGTLSDRSEEPPEALLSALRARKEGWR